MKKISFLKRHAFALVLSLVSFVVYASPPIGPGNALAFDGSTTFVYAAIPNYLTANGNSFTSEVWINPATLTTADAQTIFGYGYDDGSTGNGLQLVIGGTSGASGQIAGHLMILYSGVSNYLDCGYTFPVTNIWYHVAITRYQGVTSFFVNGVQTSNTYSNSLNTPSEFRLGSQHGIRFFKGEMDEFRFYNYPLGAGSIQQDMLSLSANSSGLSSNLVAYYHFNVGVGGANNAGLTNCPDAQNNWPGTLNNFALNGNTSNWVESYAMVIPTATAANNITSTGFTANWTAPALGTVDNYFLDISTSSDFSSFVSGYNGLSVIGLSKAVTGLTFGTTYYYRVRANKASVAGQGTNSNVITASTLAAPGAALNFDGTNDYVSLPNNAIITPLSTGQVTGSAWINMNSKPLWATIIKNWGDQNSGAFHFGLDAASGNLSIYITQSNGTVVSVVSPNSLSLNTWYNVAFTADGSTLKLYENGVVVGSAAYNGTLTTNFPGTFIGVKPNDAGNAPDGSAGTNAGFWDGNIDEVRIWKRGLSACEIVSSMNCELSGSQTGLLAYYKFNQGYTGGNNTGITSLTDASGNGNNGTLNNFALTGTSSNWIGTGGVITGTTCGPLPAATSSTTNTTICNTALPYSWNGLTFNNAGTQIAHLTNAAGCDSAASLVLTVNNCTPNYTWTGATSTDWSIATNWTNNVLPTSGVTVTIPSAPSNQPSLSTDISIAGIVLNGSIAINSHSFTITGAVTGTGKLKGSATSSLTVNSNSSSTISFGTTATDSILANLTVSGSGTLTLGSGLGINTLLTVSSGALNTGNHLTLKSTSIANTAVVGTVGGTITGNVTVERFIPKGIKSFRDVCSGGVYNTGTIFNNWQEAGVNTNGYGIFVTGKKGTVAGMDANSGLDVSPAGNISMYNYTNYLTYTPVTNTKNTNIDPYTGYLTVVYGNRALPLIPSSVFDGNSNMNAAATIRTTGQLVTGTVTYSNTGVSNSNFSSTVTKILPSHDTGTFIANPYACAIDWNSLAKTNLTATYYYYEPTFLVGGYETFVSYNTSAGTNSNPAKSKINRYIQPGQGFWIQTNSTVTNTRQLVITEANKVINQPFTAVFGTGAAGINRLAMSLWKQGENIDGAVAVFDNNFTANIGEEDSKKMFNKGENLYINHGMNILSIDGLPTPAINDVINLEMSGLISGTVYEFHLDAQEFNSNGLTAYLRDAKQNTETEIGTGSTAYSFTANASTENRYTVVFKASKPIVSNTVKPATVSVYPNPVTYKVFSVQMNNVADGKYTVSVYNAMGQEVMSKEVNHLSGSIETMNTGNLAKGIYTVSVEGKGVKSETKIVVE